MLVQAAAAGALAAALVGFLTQIMHHAANPTARARRWEAFPALPLSRHTVPGSVPSPQLGHFAGSGERSQPIPAGGARSAPAKSQRLWIPFPGLSARGGEILPHIYSF